MSNTVPLIPRKLLFGNPDKAMARLSPDGSQLSYLAPVDGVLNVWVGPAGDPAAAKPVTRDTKRGIRFYTWAFTNRHVLYIQDKGGDENWRIYGVDLTSGETMDYTPIEGVRAEIKEISPRSPTKILIALNDRNPQLHDLHLLDLISGQRELVLENEGFADFLADETYQVRFGMRITPDGGMDMMQRTTAGEWELYFHIGMQDSMTTQPFGFDRSGRYLYLSDSRERNTSGLYRLDTVSGDKTVLAEDPRADLESVMMHPVEKTVQAAAFTYERKQWQVIDPAIQADLEYLKTIADGDVEVVSRTLDDRFWVVAYLMDTSPTRYYTFDRLKQQVKFLFNFSGRIHKGYLVAGVDLINSVGSCGKEEAIVLFRQNIFYIVMGNSVKRTEIHHITRAGVQPVYPITGCQKQKFIRRSH